MVAGTRASCNRGQGWTLIFILALIAVATRATRWFDYAAGNGGYYPHIYYATLCRFDEFLPGVAVALVKNFHRPLWQRITRHGQVTLLIGTAAVAVMLFCADRFYEIDGYGYTFFETAVGYSLNAWAFALLVVAALSPSSWLARIRVPGAYHVALWSYSIYLSHKAVQIAWARELRLYNPPQIVWIGAIAITSVLIGALLYGFVEAPCMALRDRLFPSNFATATAHQADSHAIGSQKPIS